jgi:hypothetical protein
MVILTPVSYFANCEDMVMCLDTGFETIGKPWISSTRLGRRVDILFTISSRRVMIARSYKYMVSICPSLRERGKSPKGNFFSAKYQR